MIKLNKAQRQALKRKFDVNPDGAATYREFRKRVMPEGLGYPPMIRWCGMWLGIETDGTTHS